MRTLKRRLARGFIALASLVIALGCASSDLASSAQDQAGKQFAPPASKSSIYIARKAGLRGRAIHMSVSLDREVVGAIQNKTYLLLEVAPGNHRLEIGNSMKSTLPNVDFLHPVRLEVETLPGRAYFVVGNMTMGRPNVALVPESEGKAVILKGNFRRVAALR